MQQSQIIPPPTYIIYTYCKFGLTRVFLAFPRSRRVKMRIKKIQYYLQYIIGVKTKIIISKIFNNI